MKRAIIILVQCLIISHSALSFGQEQKESFSILVLDFENQSEHAELGWQIAEMCRVIIPEFKKFEVFDRGLLKTVIEKDIDLDVDRSTDVKTGLEAARKLHADYLIVGSIYKLGNFFSLNIKLVDVGTGKVIKASGIEFSNMMEIRNLSRALLSKILSSGRVSGKPVISEEEFARKKKAAPPAIYYTIGSTVLQAAALGGSLILSEKNNPNNIYTSLSLTIPSVTPFYTEDWDYAPYIIGFSLASGVFNFIGFNLMEKVPEEEKERNSRDKVRFSTGISLFTLSIGLKLTAFVLDIWRAHAAVKEYNENLRSKFFISSNISTDKINRNTEFILGYNLRF